MARESQPGLYGKPCYAAFRFYADGLIISGNHCPESKNDAPNGEKITQWLRRENIGVQRGDYFVQGDLLWLRVVDYDSVHKTPVLRAYRGEACGGKMVLQPWSSEPATMGMAVAEYSQVWGEGTPPTTNARCHVAGFKFVWQTGIGLTGHEGKYTIQTDPGETCTLTYTTPDGISGSEGTGTITADEQGICEWLWPLGNVAGNGVVTVTIDSISQAFTIAVNQSSP